MSAHTHQPAAFDRAFALGIGLNLAFVVIEALCGWHINSLALLADAGHNLSDVASLILAWAASWAGRAKPDHRHTYGWQRASIMAAFVNAVVLLIAMGALAWEAAHRLGTPGSTDGKTILIVAAAGVVVNGLTAALFVRGSHTDLNLRGAFLHMAADAMVSLGVLISGALYLWQGWPWLDPAMSLGIAAVIILGSWGLLRQSLHLLFDGVPAAINLDEVRQWLCHLPGVTAVHDLHVWAMSTSQTALTAHLVMPDGFPGNTFYQQMEHGLQERFHIHHATVQIETEALDHGCPAPAKSSSP